jgi:hypothetical protein
MLYEIGDIDGHDFPDTTDRGSINVKDASKSVLTRLLQLTTFIITLKKRYLSNVAECADKLKPQKLRSNGSLLFQQSK